MPDPADLPERRLSRLLPSPRRRDRLPGTLDLAGCRRATAAGSPAERAAATLLAERLGERAGLRLELSSASADAAGALLLRETSTGPESFTVRVDRDGALLAGDPAGLRYGAETLAQLAGPDRRLPAVRIEDAPALRRRGFLLDISRGKVPRMGSVKQIIGLLARLRYNEFFLYTEHTFQFERHPAIGAGSGGYTAAEIRELDAYASGLGVELVPCLQTFGHFRKILQKAPYRGLAESERLWSVSPEAPGTYPLLRDLLEEYLPNFASGWAHLNCDEPVDLGKGRSRERAAAEGPAALFAGHVNRVAAMARELGKRPMIWADVLADHPDALDRLDPDITLADWWYEPDHDFDRVRRFSEAGRDFLTVAGTSSWSSFFPRLDTALPNIRGHARAARRHGASGLIVTDWGDGGHFNLFAGSLYPIAFGAQCAWSDEERGEAEFAAAFSEHVAGDPSGCSGEFCARLGRFHDAGFEHFNHSPLKTVFFETKLRRTRRKPTEEAPRATLAELERLAAAVETQGLPADPTGAEWRFVLDASLLAAERGLAALRLRKASGRTAVSDPGLGRDLTALADRQRELTRRFRALWLARNRPEGLETALGLFRRATGALRRAVRQQTDRAHSQTRNNGAPPADAGVQTVGAAGAGGWRMGHLG